MKSSNFLKLLFVLSALIMSLSAMAQFPYVPQEVKNKLQIKEILLDGKKLSYGIFYPNDFNPTQKHKAMICLSGGGFSKQIAYYYFYVYTPQNTFQEYIKIYLISSEYKSVLAYNSDDWKIVMNALKDEENLTDNEWVISGASNGGLATFDLISAVPTLFEGFITIPGAMNGQELLPEWKDYKALMVYMNQDFGWINFSKSAYQKLKNHINKIEQHEIKGQGHILPAGFDIETIYKKYLAL